MHANHNTPAADAKENRRRMKGKKARAAQILKLSLFALLLCLIISLNHFSRSDFSFLSATSSPVVNLSLSSAQTENTPTPTSADLSLAAPSYTRQAVSLSALANDYTLVLVNMEQPLPSALQAKINLVSAFPTVPVLSDTVKTDDRVRRSLQELFAAAKQAGVDNLLINDGYRTYAEQKALYDKTRDKSFVQKPNHSEHQTGFAVDIAAQGVSGQNMGNSKAGRWLAQNAWQHGFILRYPENKSAITQISYEPWHFRYVGLPHAYYCYINNLCWEEYIQFLQAQKGYTLTLENQTYGVLYEIPLKNDMIYVPRDNNYTASADNTGGYIITVKEG